MQFFTHETKIYQILVFFLNISIKKNIINRELLKGEYSMKKKKTTLLVISLIFCLIFALLSCTQAADDDDDDDDTISSTTTGNILSSAVMDLPDSLSDSSTASTSATRADETGDSMTGIYGGIRQYVGLADNLTDFVKQLMVNVIESDVLNAPLDQEIVVADSTDDYGPYKVMVEKPTGTEYEWKLSTYFSANSTSPEMIIRFTIAGNTAKGRILWVRPEADENFSTLTITRKIDVTFDNTTTPHSLEIKMIQDLTEIYSYATTNWSTLTDTQKNNLDIGQPAKVFVKALFDTTSEEFTIYGTSYHPGWQTQSTLGSDPMPWSSNRNMYVFKTKAKDFNGSDGAKLYLALPVYNETDITDIWTNDSISAIFTDSMVSSLNSMLAADTNSKSIMPWFVRPSVTMPEMTTDSITEAIYNSAASYYADTQLSQLFSANYTTFIAFYDAFTGNENITKEEVFEYTIVGAYIEDNSITTVTSEMLEAFIDSTDTPTNADSLKTQYSAIKYMINPALFDSVQGFLGTYDESNDIYYEYSAGQVAAATPSATVTNLINLDLSGITPYIPNDVYTATITVE